MTHKDFDLACYCPTVCGPIACTGWVEFELLGFETEAYYGFGFMAEDAAVVRCKAAADFTYGRRGHVELEEVLRVPVEAGTREVKPAAVVSWAVGLMASRAGH